MNSKSVESRLKTQNGMHVCMVLIGISEKTKRECGKNQKVNIIK